MNNQSNQNQNKTTDQMPQRYDPQRAYFDRMNSTQRANMSRRQAHQFADSIGGCGANYRF